MEYYAYWNGDQVVAILNAVAGITNSSSFTGLLRVASVFGLMAAVIGGMFKQKLVDTWNFFLVFTLIYMGLVVPKVTVNVVDVRGGTVVPVANVPLGVGVFGAEMSHIGKWLTQTYETAFSPADDVARFGRFGIVGPQRLLNAAVTASLDVPVVKSNLSNLMKDCVIPELIDQPQYVAQFASSPNIWALIGSSGWLNPARLTMVQQPASGGVPADIIRGTAPLEAVPKPCGDAYATINTQLGLAVNVAINAIATREMPLNSGYSSTPASPGALAAAGTYIKARIEGANALLTGAAATTEQIIKQRATMDALGNAVDASNPMAASIGQAVGVGNLSAAINYRSMAQIAQDALPKLRNSIEMLVIAAFPIMVVLLLVSGLQGLPLYKGYLVMLLWTQLWAPLYAVVNFMLITSDTSPYTALINAYGAQSVPAMSLITQLGASSQDTAGMLALAIPMIALALAKGGEMALTSMASTVLSPATSAAQSSGTQLAQGNTTLGNVSWGNINEGNASRGNVTRGQVRDGSNIDTSNSVRSGDAGAMQLLGASGSRTTDGHGSEVFNVPTSQTGAVGASVVGQSSLANGSSSSRGAASAQGTRAEVSRELGSALRDATSGATAREFNQAFQAAFRETTQSDDSRRSQTGNAITGSGLVEQTGMASETTRMGGSVQASASHAAGRGRGAPQAGSPATRSPSAGAPAPVQQPPRSSQQSTPVSGGAAPTTRHGESVPPAGSRESGIPPVLRGTNAPAREVIDPTSAKAQVPPGNRIDGYATGVPQSTAGPAPSTGAPAAGTPAIATPGPAAASPGPTAADAAAGVARSAEANGVHPGYGFSLDAATTIADAARRSMQGTATQQDEKVLTAALQAARALSYDAGDRSTQSVGRRLEAALNGALASRQTSAASAETNARGENTRTEGSSNQAQGTRDLRHDIPSKMREMFPEKYGGPDGNQQLARDLQQGSPEATAATAALQREAAQGLGNSHPSGVGLARPETPGQIYSEGRQNVAAAQRGGEGAVRAAHARDLDQVGALLPGITPDSFAAPNGVPGAVNNAIVGGQQATEDSARSTAVSAGMANFAAAQFRSERGSGTEPLKLALRTLGFGAGYHSPEETNRAMLALQPHMTTGEQAFFENLGKNANSSAGEIGGAQLEQGLAIVKAASARRESAVSDAGQPVPSFGP